MSCGVNSDIVVACFVSSSKGAPVVRSAFQLCCSYHTCLWSWEQLRGGGRLNWPRREHGSGRECRCRAPCNKTLDVGIGVKMADSLFLPWLHGSATGTNTGSGGITQFQFIFLTGHTFDTTLSDNSQDRMCLRSETPTVQSSLVDLRTTAGDILLSVHNHRWSPWLLFSRGPQWPLL